MLHKPSVMPAKLGGARKHGETACDVHRRPLRPRGAKAPPFVRLLCPRLRVLYLALMTGTSTPLSGEVETAITYISDLNKEHTGCK
jgi:hypothetical protein